MAKQLFIDADGCNQHTRGLCERLAQKEVHVYVVANREIPISNPFSKMVVCSQDRDAADLYILSQVQDGDLVVSRDLLLVSKLLHSESKKVYAMSDNGEVYFKESIDARILRSNFAKERRTNQGEHGLITPVSDERSYIKKPFSSTKSTKQVNNRASKSNSNLTKQRAKIADYIERWRMELL